MVSGYKKTEIGLIPEDWDVRLLGEISMPKARIGWQNLRKDEYLDSGFYMLITGTDFSNGRVDYSTCKYVSEERYDQDINIQVGNGDILITKDGTLGKVALVTGLKMPATLNAGVFVLNNLSSLVNNEFLYHYLSTNRLMKYAERTSTGGTIQHLNQSVLISFPVPIPPLDEQIRIAKALTDTDDLIIQEERLVTKYQAVKQGCLQHMFPRKGQTEPDMRLPGFAGAWEQRKVGDYYDFKNGLNKGKEYFGTGTPIVNFTDVFNNRGITSEMLKGKVNLEASEILNYEVKEGDIFFTRTSETIEEIGYPSVMLDSPKDTVFSGFVLRGRCNANEDPLDDLFKKYVFFTESFRNEMMHKSSITTRALTSGRSIKNMEFMFPANKEEQRQIASFLTNIDDLITLHQRKCEKYKMIKQGMMEDLLTGKVRLK